MELTPSKKLRKFFANSKPTFYKKGDIVLRAGAAHSGAFFLKKGFVKDSCFSNDGREFTLFIFKSGDLFSYNWIFNELPNEHAFRAMSDCIIYEKKREELVEYLKANPDVLFRIGQKISVRLRGVLQRIESMAFGSASQRVISTIKLLAERFGTENSQGFTIPITFTQKDIAELIGISRETTSIEIKKLIDKGLLRRKKGHYIVTDLQKLDGKFEGAD